MTPEREREIRLLAAQLAVSRKHRRIARVLVELLEALDDARRHFLAA